MVKIARTTQKQFGVNGSTANFGQFGSLAVASTVTTKDPATIQALSIFTSEGWAGETIATNRPALEDFNGLDFLIFYQLCYLFQAGIAEWDVGTTYYTNSIVQYQGVVYQSSQDNNTNNIPASGSGFWNTGTNASNGVPPGVFYPFAGTVVPTGHLLCDGTAVSRTTYAALFAAIGTTYGVGNGTTTFNVPDMRTRVPAGFKSGDANFGTMGGSLGEATHQLTIPEMPSHTHNHNGIREVAGALKASTASGDNTPFPTSSTGGDQAHNNIQPSLVCNYIIKT